MRMPQGSEVVGKVLELCGGGHAKVSCSDGKTRLSRIKNKLFANEIKIKDGDVVIVKPWEVESDQKGDIVWRYNATDCYALRQQKLI